MTNSNNKVAVLISLFDNKCQRPYEVEVRLPKWRIDGECECSQISNDVVAKALASIYAGTEIDVLSIKRIEHVGHGLLTA